MATFQFDANQFEPNEDRSVIPAGWYSGVITSTEMKQTKKKDGYFLEIKTKVLDGPYRDSVIYDRFNVNNKSAEAQKIGCGQLSTLCRAVGVMLIQDTTQLHNIPFKFKVDITPADGEYSEQNEVKTYKPMSYEPPVGTDKGDAANKPLGNSPSAPAPQFPNLTPPAFIAPAQAPVPQPAPQQFVPPQAPAPMGDLPPWMQPQQ